MSILNVNKKSFKEKTPVVVIVGPTASGKSKLAIKLARKFNGEIISADSRQVYRGIDIGTAKPPLSPENQKGGGVRLNAPPFQRKGGIPPYVSNGIIHHLINIKNINQEFSVQDFKTLAEKAIKKISKRNHLPFVVGGTGLYIKALVDNLNLSNTPPNKKLRKKLDREIQKYGTQHLMEKLTHLDPEAAYTIDPQNPRRIIRALEIALTQKKPIENTRVREDSCLRILQIGIELPRSELRKRIEKRSKSMLREGLVNEVQSLIEKFSSRAEPLSAIGCREIIEYIEGKLTLEQALQKNVSSTWRYAKKQMSWFKKDNRIHWIQQTNQAEKLIKAFMK